MVAVILWYMGIRHLPKLPFYWRYSGIMVKVRDEVSGELYRGMSFSKPVSEADRKKLDRGVDIIRRIFLKAGAKDNSILALKPMGAHPSATCRIGEAVDSNLETDIRNLYCCDASVFPVSLGTPVIWTAVSLGKRLAKHIDRGLGGPAAVKGTKPEISETVAE
jgi:choline dehydrogenase-like flavoprotein